MAFTQAGERTVIRCSAQSEWKLDTPRTASSRTRPRSTRTPCEPPWTGRRWSRCITDLEMAVAYWNLVFSGRLKFLDLWNILLLVSGFLLAGAPREGSVGAVASVLTEGLTAGTVGPGPRAEVTKQQTRGHALPPAESGAQGLCPGCSEAASSGLPTSGPPHQLCSQAGATPDVLCIAREEWGLSWPRGCGSFGPGSRLRLRGACRVRAALTSGGGRAVLLRPPCVRGAALPPGGGVGAVWESPPGAAWEGPQNATRQRDTGLTWDGRCRRAHCAGHARVLRCETSWRAVCEPCACDVCRWAHSGTCCLMSWEPLGDKGEAGPGPGLPLELRAGILHVFAAPEVPRNYRGISGKVSHTTSKNSLVFRKINVSKCYLPALFLNWFGA
ncbi:DCN1-like protein 2 isoform X3 [Sagmatias obliquidens]|nr:DCN1-like protein 2 isoform X3 [Lagenorhynchus obliquidens]XP_026971570.1 DCN1-like protein 2 isoform X3 [Lagenorhynchus obliquidens]